ncbi:MAG: hypothetical protein LBT59_17350 [Clostridiales bacterium]|jgi:hypothetical protein|nr:hypothetical protein [Clostridiales bacterium]
MAKTEPGLNFEWYSIAREIQAFFVKDKEVRASDIKDGTYEITLRVCSRRKAAALASVMKLEYDFGGITGRLYIEDDCGYEYRPRAVRNLRDLRELVQTAFHGNSRVVGCEIGYFLSGDAVAVICEKALIQYYNNDISDPYENANMPVADVLRDIISDRVEGGWELKTTTKLSRDVK